MTEPTVCLIMRLRMCVSVKYKKECMEEEREDS